MENMRVEWHKEYLDLILVPSGLLIMFVYHLLLLYRYVKWPTSTCLGFENHCKRKWVTNILQIDSTSRGPALQVITSTLQASLYMASVTLALGSLILTIMGNTSTSHLLAKVIYGDTRDSIISIKFISISAFFLLAFASFVQCSRSYVHANFLLSMPLAEVPDELVIEALVHGANFWSVGLRGVYFAVTLLFWVFGPIPMFVSSVCMVIILHVLDVNRKPLVSFPGKNVV